MTASPSFPANAAVAAFLFLAYVPPLPAEQQPDVLTPACQAPQSDIAAPAPLPRLSAALERKSPIRVLAIGSSSTVGVGASSIRKSYPAQFEDIVEKVLRGVDLDVVNDGVSGEVATETAERLRKDLDEIRPDLVLWQVGTNDALAHVPVDEFEATLRDTVKRLKADGIDIVLVGMQYAPRFARDEHYQQIHHAIQRVAASENVLLVRRFDAMQFIARTRANLALLSGDDLHLNDLGYLCMAEHVAQAVVSSLYLRRRPTPR